MLRHKLSLPSIDAPIYSRVELRMVDYKEYLAEQVDKAAFDNEEPNKLLF